MSKQDETTLLIKLPPELKASFQGLCKFRGVSVSAELRRFMADEVAGTAHGMTTADIPKKPLNAHTAVLKTSKVSTTRKSYKDAVQADLDLSSDVSSAINAAENRKKTKNRKKR